jgi:galactose-1-phosphate uridylyltransferase
VAFDAETKKTSKKQAHQKNVYMCEEDDEEEEETETDPEFRIEEHENDEVN